jgi:hypothetical protein
MTDSLYSTSNRDRRLFHRQSSQASLHLARHADTWEWKEATPMFVEAKD